MTWSRPPEMNSNRAAGGGEVGGRAAAHPGHAGAHRLLVEAGGELVHLGIEVVQGRLGLRHGRAAGGQDVAAEHLRPRLRRVPRPAGEAPPLRLPHLPRVERAGGGRQHQLPHPAGPHQRILHPGPPTHGLAHQVDLAEAEMVHQRRQVVGVFVRVRPAFRCRGGEEAAMGKADAAMARGEMRDLLPPGQVAAAEAMREDQGWTAARDLEGDAAIRAVQHMALSQRGGEIHAAGPPAQQPSRLWPNAEAASSSAS
jgi:hypothetical protein